LDRVYLSTNIRNSLGKRALKSPSVYANITSIERTWPWRSSVTDSIERKMEFIIEQQATFALEIAQMKEVQSQQAISIDRLTENMHETRGMFHETRGMFHETREMLHETREMLHSVIGEMRDGFNNLIVANEVTRKLAEDVGRLAIATSQRVSVLESKLERQS